MTAVTLEGVGKRYRRGGASYRSLREDLVSLFRRPFQPEAVREDRGEFWALQDVSLRVDQGEIVGIIGRNGAGKSTLLKIIARITKPTTGRVDVSGRVGSLLEVGSGFHPELSGRENVYLNGAILGMRRAEIRRRFDEILAFAGTEAFVDTPVKYYSSGMFMRLAFAVAAHLEPEILLIDEVLSVGDAEFQKKCLGRMGQVAGEGRTVLFVSHDLHAISTLTKRAVLLDGGRTIFEGDTPSALRCYRDIWNQNRGATGEYEDRCKRTGVTQARVITSEPNQIHRFGEPLAFEFEIVFAEKPKSGVFSFQIVDEQAKPIAHLWLHDSERQWSRRGQVQLRCVLPQPRIYMGCYRLVTHLADRASLEQYEVIDGICPFEIVMDSVSREYVWVPGACAYLEDAEWSAN